MSNIAEYLEKILAARYGKDVRQSIYDAIKEVDRVADTAQDSATASAKAAAESAKNASESATAAVGSATAAASSEQNAANSAQAAAGSATAASESAQNAANSVQTAAGSATAAASSERNAAESAKNAGKSASAAAGSATAAASSEQNAANSAQAAAESEKKAEASAKRVEGGATAAESYAHGGTGSRDNEETDNAKYYKEQAERIAEGLKGSLLPMGTITFAQLPESPKEGYMYNISDEFVTTDRFKEGAGRTIPAGTNVYYTADGYWDCMAGSPVTGVKGAKEESYRRGNINLTPQNIGALPEDGNAATATKAQQDATGRNIVDTYLEKTGDTGANTVTFTSGDSASAVGWSNIPVLSSGERHSSILEKLSTMLKNVRYLNASKADSNHTHAWGSLSGTPSSFPPAPHGHDYLPLSGGTVTGNFAVTGNLSSDRYYTATPGRTMVFESGGFVNIQVGQSAQVRNQGDTGWAAISAREFVQQSSKRYKENIEEMTEEYAKKLLELRPVSYDYKNKADGVGCYGLIAEEVDAVESYPVFYNDDHAPEGIDYSKFVPQIIKLLQMHEKELEKLKENREIRA